MATSTTNYREEFAVKGITRVPNFIADSQTLGSLQEEAAHLERYAENFSFSAHSAYRHVKPCVFAQQNPPSGSSWRLLDFYHSDWLLEQLKAITGMELRHMPVVSDPRFEINCKLNYYKYGKKSGGKSSKLGWHYDRSDQVKGKVVVAVLTLHNQLDSILQERGTGYMDATHPTLSYFPRGSLHKERIYSMANSLEVHLADSVLHRANPLKVPEDFTEDTSARHIFVMKFATDNTPLTSPLAIGLKRAAFAGKSVISYARVNIVIVSLIGLLAVTSLWWATIAVLARRNTKRTST